jgi:hypothetical protein
MDYVMRGILGVLTYIDDVLVHNKGHEDHLRTVEEVLLRLRKYGLKLNADKSIFGATTVQYLGYTINEEGVTLSTDKMAAIRDSRPPSNLKQIREFVGLANYFRFLIKDFSKMSAPMTALTKKDSGWKEGKLPEEAYIAFLGLKEKLMQQPIVAYPKREGRFMLRTDTCLGDKDNVGGLGAVLLQQQSTCSDRKSKDDAEDILFPEAEMDQSKDALMADIIRYMKTGDTPEKSQTQYRERVKRLAHNSFLDEENRLWYRLTRKDRERIAFWTPRHMRKELMVAAHISIEAGHGGVARTVTRLQLNYYC